MLEGLKKAISSMKQKVTTTTISEESVSRELDEFRMNLVSNDVAVEVADKIIQLMVEKLEKKHARRFSSKKREVDEALRETLEELLIKGQPRELLLTRIESNHGQGKVTVVLFVGPNGGGKTTTVVKVAHYLRKNGYESIIACSDTFRAGAIEQLAKLADEAKVRTIRRSYGADPASVAVDAIMSARASKIPVVLIDTAGRTEINRNLLEEMRKIKRVTQPDLVIYVGDALTGNVAVQQAQQFNDYTGLDGIILTKVDADAKGGSAISIGSVIGKPIVFLGTGQELDTLVEFDKAWFLERLLA